MGGDLKKPNILIFMTDQQRGDSILNPAVYTPNMDRFRKEGITFTEAFCSSPHCCPSRASFFTGLYPSRHGVWNNVDVANALSRTTKTEAGFFSDILKEEGYRMNFGGKWHVSSTFGPSDIGWKTGSVKGDQASNRRINGEAPTLEEMEREKNINWSTFRRGLVDREDDIPDPGDIIRPGYPRYTHYGECSNPFGDIDVADEAVETIRRRAESGDNSPFIQYVGLLGPHDPYKVPRKYLDMIDRDSVTLPDSFFDSMEDKPGFYKRIRNIYSRLPMEQHIDALHHYYAFCSFIDDQFGKVLSALEKTGQRDNTLVLFISDHGDYAGEHGLWTKGLAGFRGAYHIPAVVRWPAGISDPGRSVDEMISITDFAPTFIELGGRAGANPHGEINMDDGSRKQIPFHGRSLVPFFRNENCAWRDSIYAQSNGNELYGIQRIVFDRQFKFVFNGFDFDELYNLEHDPGETVNLISGGVSEKYRETVKKYYKKLWEYALENGDQYNNAYINTAYPDFGPGELFM